MSTTTPETPKNLKFLTNIGTKLSDFEEVPHKDKRYFFLGKGSFGYAEKMKSKINGKFYAVKKIDRKSKKFKIKDFKRETGIMSELDHKNLIRLYGFFEDKEKIEKFKDIYKDSKNVDIGTEDKAVCCIVLEFADNGSLEGYYKKYKSSKENFKNGKVIDASDLQNKSEDEIKQIINDNYIPLDQKIVIKFFKQLLEATKYLHSKSIIHRDIKPDNILLDENNNIKITDFGISAIVRDTNVANLNKDNDLFSNFTRQGRIDFVCPEMFTQEQYDYQADIFSLGLTMLCLMSYRYPIIIIKGPNGKSRDFKRGYMLKYYNEYLRNLVLRMIDEENNNIRPSAKEALDELLKIEKYIENPGANTSVKAELDRKNEITNIKRSKTQNSTNTPQVNQNSFQNNQNNQLYQNNPNNQMYPNNGYGPNINNNAFYQGNLLGNMNNQNYNQINMYNGYQNFNNQIYPQNTYANNQAYYPNQFCYQYNQGMYYQNNNMQNQNMMNMNMNLNNMANMMNMTPNANQNMMSLSANNVNINNINIKPKNTSLIRVLQCLHGCFEDIGPIENLQNMVNNWYSSNNIKDTILLNIYDNLSRAINPDNNFIISVDNLKNKINAKTNLFFGNENVLPNLIFFWLFKLIDEEYKKNNIPYNCTIFDNLKTIEKIPQSSLQLILGKIEEFKQFSTPCYNNFYYLCLDVIKCPRCKNILAVNEETFLAYNFLGVPGGFDDNVINLIKYAVSEESENTDKDYTCKCGIYKGHGTTEKAFLNTPKYLFIDFEGKAKIQKHLDEKIDLTQYKLTHIGPNQYYLYAFILKDNEQYIAYVKEGSSWTSYYNEINKTQYPSIKFDWSPYYAIYKGLEYN